MRKRCRGNGMKITVTLRGWENLTAMGKIGGLLEGQGRMVT